MASDCLPACYLYLNKSEVDVQPPSCRAFGGNLSLSRRGVVTGDFGTSLPPPRRDRVDATLRLRRRVERNFIGVKHNS